MSTIKLGVLLSVWAVSACTGGDTLSTPSDVVMEIGLATDEQGNGYQVAQSGSDVELQVGGQGGYHIWTTPRFTGVQGTVYIDRVARRVEDGVLVMRASRYVLDIPVAAMDSWWHDHSLLSFMCPTPIGVKAFDTEIEFRFLLLNEDEEELAEDELTVIPRCPDGGQEYCRSICSGL